MGDSLERCVVCLSSRRCAHTRPHHCKGMPDEPCGPWPICVKCSNHVCQKSSACGKEAVSSQFGCPVCKAELGPRRRALEEGSAVTQWPETPDTPEQAWQAPPESAAQRAMRKRNLPELRRLLGVVPSADQMECREAAVARAQQPAFGNPPTPGAQRSRWAAVLSRQLGICSLFGDGQAFGTTQAVPLAAASKIDRDKESERQRSEATCQPVESDHEHGEASICKDQEHQRLEAELQKREAELRRREEEAAKERERLRLEAEHRQRREVERQRRKQEMERKEKERLQLEKEHGQREAELQHREEEIRKEMERLRLEAEHREAKLRRRDEEGRKEIERLRLEAEHRQKESERQRQEDEARTERERLRLESEHRQLETERRRREEETELQKKAGLALGSLSQLYLATVPPAVASSRKESGSDIRAMHAVEEDAHIKRLQAEAKAAEHAAVEAAVAAAQAEEKHRSKSEILSSPRPLFDRRHAKSKHRRGLGSPMETPAQACRGLDDAALTRCPDALLQAFFAEYVQEKADPGCAPKVVSVPMVVDSHTALEREASKRLQDEVTAIRREETIRRRSFSLTEARHVRQQDELEANLRLESERQRCKLQQQHKEEQQRAFKAAREQERLQREADVAECRRQEAERRKREEKERLRLEIEYSRREAERHRREEEARRQIEVERRSREEEHERLCVAADRRRLKDAELRRQSESEARLKIEAERRRQEEQETLQSKVERRQREDEKKHFVDEAQRQMQQQHNNGDDAEQKRHALQMKRRQLEQEERRVAEKRHLLAEQEKNIEHKRRRLAKDPAATPLVPTQDASPGPVNAEDTRPVQTPVRADRAWVKSHIARGKCSDVNTFDCRFRGIEVAPAVSNVDISQETEAQNMESTDNGCHTSDKEGTGMPPCPTPKKDDVLLARIKQRMDSVAKNRSAASSHVPSSSSSAQISASAPATQGNVGAMGLCTAAMVKTDATALGAAKARLAPPPSSSGDSLAPAAKAARVAAPAVKAADVASCKSVRAAAREKEQAERKASSMLARMQLACGVH